MKKILIAFIVVFLSNTTFANVTLKGTITDSNGSSLEEANIRFGTGDSEKSTDSDKNGYKFTDLDNLPIDEPITFEKADYYTITANITEDPDVSDLYVFSYSSPGGASGEESFSKIGNQGSSLHIREIANSSVDKAWSLFTRISQNRIGAYQSITTPNGTILKANMSSNNFITYRTFATNSPNTIATVEINFANLFDNVIKLKFNN